MNYDFMNAFESNHEEIYKDYLSVKDAVKPWPERHLYGNGWDAYGIFVDPNIAKLLGREYKIKENECAFTKNLIEKHIPSHGTAGFSILRPGTEIKPHMGVQGEYLRMHLGLEVPKGDLGLNSASHGAIVWEKGKAFYFDDRLMHEAWNRTNETRVILIVDFKEK